MRRGFLGGGARSCGSGAEGAGGGAGDGGGAGGAAWAVGPLEGFVRRFGTGGPKGRSQARVCFVGGSITAQRLGWRSELLALWNDERAPQGMRGRPTLFGERVFGIDSHMGNVGTPVLNFLAHDWVIQHEPDLVFLDASVNDGDHIIENGDCGAEDVRRALEGLVRQIRRQCPQCTICFVHMYLRTYLPCGRRTGTQAWADGHFSERELEGVYGPKGRVRAIYEAVAKHYECASLDLGNLFAQLPRQKHDLFFRDDCHHSLLGARSCAQAVTSAFCAWIPDRTLSEYTKEAHSGASVEQDFHQRDVLNEFSKMAVATTRSAVRLALADGAARRALCAKAYEGIDGFSPRLPGCLDPLHWTGGQAALIGSESVLIGHEPGGAASRRVRDRDPISGGALDWWILRPGDVLRASFSGVGFGLLTHVGPDSGWVSYEFTPRGIPTSTGRGGGRAGRQMQSGRKCLFDEWSYYYRLNAVMLETRLPEGDWDVTVRLEPGPPDRKAARRPAPPGVQGLAPRLWASYSLAVGTWSAAARSLPPPPPAAAPAAPAPPCAPPGGGVAAPRALAAGPST